MKNKKASSASTKQPHFLMGLLGREAEMYADAYLVSQEGNAFPVVRSLLAMKCNFFKEKFFPASVEKETRSDSDPDCDGTDHNTDDMEIRAAFNASDRQVGATANRGDQTGGSTADRAVSTSAPTAAIPSSSGTRSARGHTARAEESQSPRASSFSGARKNATSSHAQSTRHGPGGDTDSISAQSPIGSTKPSYPMPFPMILLKQVVEFIYTDAVTFLEDVEITMKPSKAAPNTTYVSCPPSCEVVSHIVELARVADYTRLKKLCLRCCLMIQMVVKARKSTACAALGAIRRSKHNPEFLERMASLLVKSINGDVRKSFCIVPCNKAQTSGQEANSQCYGAFGLCTIMHLNDQTLEEIINSQPRGFSDEYMLQVVFFWATGGKRFTSSHVFVGATGDDDTSTADVEEGTVSEQHSNTADLIPEPSAERETSSNKAEEEMRKTAVPLIFPKKFTPHMELRFSEGKVLASKFSLSAMNPSFLHEYVENSGLVDKETLYNVYRYRALSGPRFGRIFSIRKKTCPPRCDQMSTADE